MFIPVILGTAREGRMSEKVAQYVLEQAQQYGKFDTELVDVKDYQMTRTIPSWEENDLQKKWAAYAQKCDGYILVLPEYNHSYPGEFKLLIDMAYMEYARKPFAICGVSSGAYGGARMIEHIKPLIVNFNAVAIGKAVSFFTVSELFDDKGAFVGDKELYAKGMSGMFEELVWYADNLKKGRS